MTNTTKAILIIVVIAIIILGIWYGTKKPAEEPAPETKEPIKIGVIGHFSGEFANYSIPMKNAVEMIVEEINQQGGVNGKELQLIIEDDGTDPNKAASGMNKLVNIDKVNYVISAQGSGQTSVVSPIAQNNKKILMITLASAPELVEVGDYVFRSIPSDDSQAVKMVEFINDTLQSKKVAGLYVNDAYGVGIKNIVNQNKNVEIVASEMFESGATDFRTQLLKIKEKSADTLVLVARRDEYPTILRQIHELNFIVKILASETFKDEEVIKDSGAYAEEVYLTFMDEHQDFLNFNNNYKSRFNEEPSAYAIYAYDGVLALIKAIESTDDNIESVRPALGILQFDGASGTVSFNSKGDRTGVEYTLYVVKNGKFVPYED